MSSPSIDLDMNLLSSPVPTARDRSGKYGEGGGGIGQVQVPSTTENCIVNNSMKTSTRDSFSALDSKRGENSRPSTAMTSQEHQEDTNNGNESTQGEASNERMIVGNKSTQN